MGQPLNLPLRPLLAAAVGAVASLPLPLAGVGLTWATGHAVFTPSTIALGLVPVIAAATAVGFADVTRRWARVRAGWAQDRAALVERRRTLAAEAAQLQSVELDLLADLETAEAELDGRDAVLNSLVSALQDTLVAVDRSLQGVPDAASTTTAAQQIGELLELVDDVRAFVSPTGGDAGAAPVELAPTIDKAVELARSRVNATQDVTWTLDEATPDWISGGANRLDTVMEAAVREACRTDDGPVHLTMGLVVADGVRGLRISWGDADDGGLTDGIGARIADALGEPPVLGSRAQSVTWWLREPVEGAIVPKPLPNARVLLAATTPGNRARLRRLLLRWGLDVSVARSGADTLARMDAGDIDIVLLDLHDESLPTLEQLRQHPAHRTTPVLVLSPNLDNLVWLHPPTEAGVTRPVHQSHLRNDLAEIIDLQLSAGHQLATSTRTRVLILEPNATLASALVRAGADAGCEVVTTSSVRAMRERAGHGAWDLVLVDRDAGALHQLAAALTDLPDDVIRLVVGPTVHGKDRNDARSAGFTDAAVRPTRPAQLARLLSLVTEPPAMVRGVGSTSR